MRISDWSSDVCSSDLSFEQPPSSFPRWRDIAEGASSYLVSNEAIMALDMWLAVGSDARPPARGNLMPESIAGVPADTCLMDYSAETRDLRYRLVGVNIRSSYDFPLVGQHIGEILAPEASDRVRGYFRACVEQP